MAEDVLSADICRVCRSEGTPDRPLFHPCICTGSIKWIHQECLVQWMRYSRKEYCELCGYRFSFTPIYSPDMPRRLPLRDVVSGLVSSILTAVKYWLHYTLVAIAWLGIVPLTACRTYRAVFSGSLDLVRIMSLPMDLVSTENISADVFHGCFVISCTLFTFIGLVWLREQILHAGGPDWLERDIQLPPVDNPLVDRLNHPLHQQQVHQEGQRHDNNNVPPFAEDPPRADQNHQNAVEFLFRAVADYNVGDRGGADVADLPAEVIDVVQGNNVNPGRAVDHFQAGARFAAEEAMPEVLRLLPHLNAGVQPNADLVDEWRDQEQPRPPGDAEEANWNPMEWDRPAEELTWERLLGLDGSLLFLEHVFWVISLNTLFIMLFAFCPYQVGYHSILLLSLQEYAIASHFEGLLTTLCGYCVIGIFLMTLHALAALLGFQRSQRILGLGYVIVKVSVLSVIEIGLLPLICGWWLDICSLAMFDATLRDRESSFRMAPGTSMFIHWLVGMIYIYYFASFILLLREVLRPGVLWFLRNLNEPDFSPLQEMIHLSILRHIKRLVGSTIIFGTAILLMLWLPIKMLRWTVPGFLPYTVTVQTEAQISELSLELLLLQVILPALLEQSHTRTWLKALVRGWCQVVAWLLDLQSYLLKEQADDAGPPIIEERLHADLAAVHQAIVPRDGPVGYQPYVKPRWFHFKIVGLILCVCISLVIASVVSMTLPVWIGRRVMTIWMVGAPAPSPPVLAPLTLTRDVGSGDVPTLTGRVHEVYTIACGTYVCWAVARGLALAVSWFPRGRRAVLERIKHWGIISVKAFISCVLLVGIIPLMFGILLELVVVVPLRVPLEQSPILFVWQDWALGVLYTKIATAVTMMGPEWRLRLAIERAYNDGIREMDLKFIIKELAAPVICCFGLSLAIPYSMAYGLVPLIVSNIQTQTLVARRLYPFLLLVHVACIIISIQIQQFGKLYEHIKNDKYLVGQRLVNYEHRIKTQTQKQFSSQNKQRS